MKTEFLIFFLFGLILLTISCDLQKVFKNQSSENQASSINAEQDPALKSNRELWAKSGICSYKMTLEASNLNPTKFNSPVDLEIQDGSILNVELVSSSNERLTAQQKEFIKDQYKDSATVEKLFDFASFVAKEKRRVLDLLCK